MEHAAPIGRQQRIQYAYIHGFASGPHAAKGQMLQESFKLAGMHLRLPNLNQPSFDKMTFTDALSELDRMHRVLVEQGDDIVVWRLIGSSMGSYLAARWAELHPECVDRLLLLSPAFDFPSVIRGMAGESTMREWQAKGTWACPGPDGKLSQLHWNFVDDASRHPAEPRVLCPTLILHGRNDVLVPVGIAEKYANAHEGVDLVVVDDDHGLIKSMPLIIDLISHFFEIYPSLIPTLPPNREVAQLDHSVELEGHTQKLAKL